MGEFLQFSLNGIMNGAVYALIAVGIVAVYKSTKVVNFAHGHIIMFGAYIFYTFVVLVPQAGWAPGWYQTWEPQWLAASAAAAQPFSFDAAIVTWVGAMPRIVVALFAAIVFNGALGVLIERFLLRPLLRQSTFSRIMVTVGLISVLNGLVTMLWTADADYVPYLGPHGAIWFEVFATRIFLFGSSLTNFVIACLVFGAILALFFLTRAGVALRATAEDPVGAASLGINVPWLFSMSWVLACVTGAVAGAILATSNGVTPALGNFGLVVLAIVIMGGLDSFAGCALAALTIGWLEAMTQWRVGSEYADILPYASVLLVILIRPHGLLGHATVERV